MATALPAISTFTDSSVTEAGFKSSLTDMRAYLAGLLGTDGEVLTALRVLDGFLTHQATKTANYTVVTDDLGRQIRANSASAITFTLPAAATAGQGFNVVFKNINSGTLTIDGDGAETIDGAASITLEQNESCVVQNFGSAWNSILNASAVADGGIDTAKLADGAATLAKTSGVLGNTQKSHTAGSQATTTAYVTFATDSITVAASSTIVAVATVKFEYSDVGGANSFTARLVIDGTEADLYQLNVSSGSDNDLMCTLIGQKTGVSSGARTITVQIKKDASANSSTARTCDILLFEETT